MLDLFFNNLNEKVYLYKREMQNISYRRTVVSNIQSNFHYPLHKPTDKSNLKLKSNKTFDRRISLIIPNANEADF